MENFINSLIRPSLFNLKKIIPKKDGRVEVPKNLTNILHFDVSNNVFLFIKPGLIIITSDFNYALLDLTRGESWRTKETWVSYNRIRIPFSALKLAKMEHKPLSMYTDGKYIIVQINKEFIKDKIIKWTNVYCEASNELKNLLLDNKNNIPLLAPDFGFTTIRVIGSLYEIKGNWVKKSLSDVFGTIVCPGNNKFFLIPVIHRNKEKNNFSWLITTPSLAYNISNIINKQKRLNFDPHEFDIILSINKAITPNIKVFKGPTDFINIDLEKYKNKINFINFIHDKFYKNIDGIVSCFPCNITNKNFKEGI